MKHLKLLAIDTSTERASVAVTCGDELLEETQSNLRQHAQFLLPMVDQLLKTADLSFKQLDGIVFGAGPGSFTGLRIACSVAKGLAYAHDLPMYPISSLASIAYHVKLSEGFDTTVLSMIDARMQQVYWGYFTNSCFQVSEQVSSAHDIHVSSQPVILAGVGLETYLPHLSQSIVKHIERYPSASAMIRLAQTGNFSPVTAAEALPVYIRNQVTSGGSNG